MNKIEEFLFAMFKDTELISAKKFKVKIKKYKVEDPTELYKRIVNYQIKKYGKTIGGITESVTPEVLEKRGLIANKRKYYERHKEEIIKRNKERYKRYN